MLIAAFARRAGLSIDTVRYYVRRGLLHPHSGTRGGRNPYQEFTTTDLDAAAIIRTGQALVLGLSEISAFLSSYRTGNLSRNDLVSFLTNQRARLLARSAELGQLADFLTAKIAWIEAGETGEQPLLDDYRKESER